MRRLSIVIPAYDEERRLGRTLESIDNAISNAQLTGIDVVQIIVADDGSTDRTGDIARSWQDRLPIEVIRLPKNRGKGAATRVGMQAAKGDYALIYDADAATPITELPRFFSALESHSAHIAIGSRVHGTSERPVQMSLLRRVVGRTYHALCAGLHPGIEDAACGCKLFSLHSARAIFQRQRVNRFAYDIEMLALARKLHYPVVEVPVTWTAVPISKVRLVRDGMQMLGSVVSMYIRKMLGRL